jgi:hypothetical protein
MYQYKKVLAPYTEALWEFKNNFADSSVSTFNLTQGGSSTSFLSLSPGTYVGNYQAGPFVNSGINAVNYLVAPTAFNTVFARNFPSFTIEAYVYLSAFNGGNGGCVWGFFRNGINTAEWSLRLLDNGGVRIIYNDTASDSAAGIISLGQWYHTAVTYDGYSYKAYVSPVSAISSTPVININIGLVGGLSSATNFTIGAVPYSTSYLFPLGAQGYVANVRVCSSVKTSFPILDSDKIQSNGILPNTIALYPFNGNSSDSGQNALNLTVGGTVPYATTPVPKPSYITGAQVAGPYSATNKFFGPTGLKERFSNLTAYTIQFYVYLSSLTAVNQYVCAWDSGVDLCGIIVDNTGKIGYLKGATYRQTAAGAIATNTWTHVAVVVTGGNVSIYVNGALSAGPISAGTAHGTVANFTIGAYLNGVYPVDGYIANFRLDNVARTSFPTVD